MAVGMHTPAPEHAPPVHGVNGYYIINLVSRSDSQVVMALILVFSPGVSSYSAAPQPPWFVAHLAKLESDAHVQFLVGSRKAGS